MAEAEFDATAATISALARYNAALARARSVFDAEMNEILRMQREGWA